MTPNKLPRIAALGIAALLAVPTIPAMAQRSQQSPTQQEGLLPDELFAPVGTVLTVQVRDYLSSDKNSAGDAFLGMLQQPLVIDGWVVARPGQTVFGQIISANRAGRAKGTSDLGIELTEIMLVDGQQAPVRTQLLKNYGKESRGEDAGAIAGSTAIGTIIGVALGGGKGAAIGAGVGAAAATVGVLSTRGKPTEIYPESSLTFRLDAPLIVSTTRSRQAFAAVAPNDYSKTPVLRVPPRRDSPPPTVIYEPYPRFPRHLERRVFVAPAPAVVVIPSVVIHDRGRHGRR